MLKPGCIEAKNHRSQTLRTILNLWKGCEEKKKEVICAWAVSTVSISFYILALLIDANSPLSGKLLGT
jgi:hypothetical protein